MKILATNDVHQWNGKFKSLVQKCEQIKPDVVVIAGDVLPKHNGIEDQMSYEKHIVKYAKRIKNAGSEFVLTLGNDDNQNFVSVMEKYDGELWHYVDRKSINIGGYDFVGMPCVPDYPFGYKYWVYPDTKENFRIDPFQYGDPVEINSDNVFETIKDGYYDYLSKKKPIYDCLMDLSKEVDIDKSIWLIHCPPSKKYLDLCAHGARVGSDAVLKFIKKKQPFLTIHGHIHEAPEYNGNIWYADVGKTKVVQGGQLDRELYYIEIDMMDGQVVKMRHSIYGEHNGNRKNYVRQ